MNDDNKTYDGDESEELDFNSLKGKDHDRIESRYDNNLMGPLIKEARTALGLSQREVAERCGMAESRLSEIENNAAETKISTIRKIIELGLGGSLNFIIKL